MFGTGQLPKFEDDQFWTIKGELLATLERDAASAEAADEQQSYAALLIELRNRAPWPHPHRRSSAHQSRPQIHRRREGIADAPDGADAVFPRRSGSRRARHPRHDPPASVHQGRTGLDHDAGDQPRRARAHARLRGGSVAPARPALPRDDAVCRRHGLFGAKDLRHRGLDARARAKAARSGKSRAARSAANSRRGGWMPAIAGATANRASCTR